MVRKLYDRVVMSSTYSQMVKNDFQFWGAQITRALIDPAPAADERRLADVDDAAATFRDDLAVVAERALSPENHAAVVEIGAAFAELTRAQRARLAGITARDDAAALARARAWSINPERRALLNKISDLNDRIVADGYEFRVASEARTAAIKTTSVAFSLAVLILNALCLGLVFVTILPRLRRLTAVCADIAAGNFQRRVSAGSNDELGVLAVAFNVMLEALRQSEEKVQEQLITTNAMMDGLGQGFLMIAPDGSCLPVHSRACVDLLETNPAGQSACRVLGVPESGWEDFGDWLDVLFTDVGTFEDLAKLGPATYPHSGKRAVTLEYRPLRDHAGVLRAVVVVATDRTAEVCARGDAEREQEFARMVTKLMRNRADFARFRHDARGLIEQLNGDDVAAGLRALHTLKGGAATLSLTVLNESAHARETEIQILTARRAAASEVRAAFAAAQHALSLTLDQTYDSLRAQFGFDGGAGEPRREIAAAKLTAFHQLLRDALVADDVREAFARDILSEPAHDVFAAYPGMVRDLAERLGKRAEFGLTGGEVAFHRAPYVELLNAFVHLVRNAVDHGVESADERACAGKAPVASIRLDVTRFPGSIPMLRLTVSDDGRGVDVGRLRTKLIARGTDVSGLDDHAVIQHVFDADVSTAAEVTELSGRGIGMNAVREAARALGGRVDVRSIPGQATTVTLEVPELAPGMIAPRAA